MRTIILAIFALLSLSISAQENETPQVGRPTDQESLYNLFETHVAKPLEERGISVRREEQTAGQFAKSITIQIPIMPVPEVENIEGQLVAVDKKYAKYALECYDTYRIFIKGIEYLSKSATECYWWEKNSEDSLMISMKWNLHEATILNVHKTAHDNSNTPYTPRCIVTAYFSCPAVTVYHGTMAYFHESDEIFDEVQVAPEFPGGIQGLSEYIMRSLRYPVEGIMNDLQAEMLVSFVVEKDGSVSSDNIEISNVKLFYKDSSMGELNEQEESNKPLVEAFLKEAKRVVSQMPQWAPGKVDGKVVRTRMSLPINFTLE